LDREPLTLDTMADPDGDLKAIEQQLRSGAAFRGTPR
jgi:hypothetical protein